MRTQFSACMDPNFKNILTTSFSLNTLSRSKSPDLLFSLFNYMLQALKENLFTKEGRRMLKRIERDYTVRLKWFRYETEFWCGTCFLTLGQNHLGAIYSTGRMSLESSIEPLAVDIHLRSRWGSGGLEKRAS